MCCLKKYIPFLCIILCSLWGCSAENHGPDTGKTDLNPAFVTATLFSDVDFWEVPDWSLDAGTLSAEISEQTGLMLETIIPPQDADRALSLLLLKNELPDIMALTDASAIQQLISSGKVWNLEEFLKRYCPDSDLLTDFPEDMKQALIRRNGAWYSYPSHINSLDAKKIWKTNTSYYEDYDQYGTTVAVIWNRDLLEKAGLDLEDVQTESQVLKAFQKVKDMDLTVDGQEVIPLLMDGASYQQWTLAFLNNSFGAEVVDENGNYKERWLQPEAKKSLKFVNRALRRGYAYSQHLAISNSQVKSYIASGAVFCFIGNTANTGMDPKQWVSSGSILSDTGERPVLGRDIRMVNGWIETLISKDCRHPEQIARWLDYMSDDEGMLKNNYGFEGIDYTLNGDGTITLTEAGRQKRRDSVKTGYSAWWNFGNIAWERSILPTPRPDSSEAHTKEIECALGKYKDTYIFDNTLLALPNDYIPADSSMGRIQTDITDFKQQQISKIIASRSDAEFEEQYEYFLSRLKALGIEQLDSKIDRQVQKNFKFYGERIEKVNQQEVSES